MSALPRRVPLFGTPDKLYSTSSTPRYRRGRTPQPQGGGTPRARTAIPTSRRRAPWDPSSNGTRPRLPPDSLRARAYSPSRETWLGPAEGTPPVVRDREARTLALAESQARARSRERQRARTSPVTPPLARLRPREQQRTKAKVADWAAARPRPSVSPATPPLTTARQRSSPVSAPTTRLPSSLRASPTLDGDERFCGSGDIQRPTIASSGAWTDQAAPVEMRRSSFDLPDTSSPDGGAHQRHGLSRHATAERRVAEIPDASANVVSAVARAVGAAFSVACDIATAWQDDAPDGRDRSELAGNEFHTDFQQRVEGERRLQSEPSLSVLEAASAAVHDLAEASWMEADPPEENDDSQRPSVWAGYAEPLVDFNRIDEYGAADWQAVHAVATSAMQMVSAAGPSRHLSKSDDDPEDSAGRQRIGAYPSVETASPFASSLEDSFSEQQLTRPAWVVSPEAKSEQWVGRQVRPVAAVNLSHTYPPMRETILTPSGRFRSSLGSDTPPADDSRSTSASSPESPLSLVSSVPLTPGDAEEVRAEVHAFRGEVRALLLVEQSIAAGGSALDSMLGKYGLNESQRVSNDEFQALYPMLEEDLKQMTPEDLERHEGGATGQKSRLARLYGMLTAPFVKARETTVGVLAAALQRVERTTAAAYGIAEASWLVDDEKDSSDAREYEDDEDGDVGLLVNRQRWTVSSLIGRRVRSVWSSWSTAVEGAALAFEERKLPSPAKPVMVSPPQKAPQQQRERQEQGGFQRRYADKVALHTAATVRLRVEEVARHSPRDLEHWLTELGLQTYIEALGKQLDRSPLCHMDALRNMEPAEFVQTLARVHVKGSNPLLASVGSGPEDIRTLREAHAQLQTAHAQLQVDLILLQTLHGRQQYDGESMSAAASPVRERQRTAQQAAIAAWIAEMSPHELLENGEGLARALEQDSLLGGIQHPQAKAKPEPEQKWKPEVTRDPRLSLLRSSHFKDAQPLVFAPDEQATVSTVKVVHWVCATPWALIILGFCIFTGSLWSLSEPIVVGGAVVSSATVEEVNVSCEEAVVVEATSVGSWVGSGCSAEEVLELVEITSAAESVPDVLEQSEELPAREKVADTAASMDADADEEPSLEETSAPVDGEGEEAPKLVEVLVIDEAAESVADALDQPEEPLHVALEEEVVPVEVFFVADSLATVDASKVTTTEGPSLENTGAADGEEAPELVEVPMVHVDDAAESVPDVLGQPEEPLAPEEVADTAAEVAADASEEGPSLEERDPADDAGGSEASLQVDADVHANVQASEDIEGPVDTGVSVEGGDAVGDGTGASQAVGGVDVETAEESEVETREEKGEEEGEGDPDDDPWDDE